MSDAATRDAQTALARTLVDEWVRHGVRHAALAPGSRSTPLALALARDGRIRLEVFVDERSAAFFALGTAKESGRPAVVVCTSGTAAAHFHAAVLEAHHSRTPLLVCTADRPPELRDVGAGQTIDQTKLYGDAVRWFVDPGPPEDSDNPAPLWRSLASRAVAETLGPPAGPVHLNLPFREPLVPTGAPVPEAPGRADGAPWTRTIRARRVPDPTDLDRLAQRISATERGLLVAGWGAAVDAPAVARFAGAAGWPVLADPLSGVRTGPHAVSTYGALLRVPGFADACRPDLVLRVGAALTGKTSSQWLDESVPQILVDPDGVWLDPRRATSERVAVDAQLLLEALADRVPPSRTTSWLDVWTAAEANARRAIDELVDGWDTPFEGRVARDVVTGLPDGSTLVVASSMPVRDVEAFAIPRSGVRFIANRGTNGVDGFVSTVLGVAAIADGACVALLGDLALLHDSNGLLGAARRGIDATFVVLDNDGGGIFSFLPQAEAVPESFELLFGTPHGLDLTALAALHDIPVAEASTSSDVIPALQKAIAAGGVQLVLVRTDRADNVARHREVWAAARVAVGV